MNHIQNPDIRSGRLFWADTDTVALAEQYGTPLYVMDEHAIHDAAFAHKAAFEAYFSNRGRAYFASKSFCCKAMYQIVASEGMGADVVSGGELYTALAAGMDPAKIIFHGNNKQDDELIFALNNGVGLICVDNLFELQKLNYLAQAANVKQGILLRIKPGVEAHTHAFIRTGQIDSKFGLALETGEAMDAVYMALDASNLELKGLHCHIGSQIFDPEPFGLAAKVMLEFMAQIRLETGVTLEALNLGGGFGIAYLPGDRPVPVSDYYRVMHKALTEACEAMAFPVPYIMTEPGRSIAGPAGITLYRVGGIKEIPGVRTYVSIDGGMTDNPRYALYQSDYCAIVANRADQPMNKTVTLAGKCCESGDLLQENLPLQTCIPGDVLAVFSTGAYNYSMSSNYNRIPRPAVVFCRDGESRVVVERESYEDLIRLDR